MQKIKIPEGYSPNSPSFISAQRDGKFETGKFNLVLKLIAPESLTGISQDKQNILQEWELLECIKSVKNPLDGIYVFEAWGRTACVVNNFCDNQHHEGRKMYIDREFFETKIITLMYLDDRVPDEQLINTIGLEYVKFG